MTEESIGPKFRAADAIQKDLENYISLMAPERQPPEGFDLKWLSERLVEAGWVKPTRESHLTLGGDMMTLGNSLYAKSNDLAGSVLPRGTEIVILKVAPDSLKPLRDIERGRPS